MPGKHVHEHKWYLDGQFVYQKREIPAIVVYFKADAPMSSTDDFYAVTPTLNPEVAQNSQNAWTVKISSRSCILGFLGLTAHIHFTEWTLDVHCL